MQYVSTENVSPYGARVRTNRPWKKGTSVLVKSALGELCARARIVYCQPLPANAFALGLQFLFGLAHGSRQRDAEYSDCPSYSPSTHAWLVGFPHSSTRTTNWRPTANFVLSSCWQ